MVTSPIANYNDCEVVEAPEPQNASSIECEKPPTDEESENLISKSPSTVNSKHWSRADWSRAALLVMALMLLGTALDLAFLFGNVKPSVRSVEISFPSNSESDVDVEVHGAASKGSLTSSLAVTGAMCEYYYVEGRAGSVPLKGGDFHFSFPAGQNIRDNVNFHMSTRDVVYPVLRRMLYDMQNVNTSEVSFSCEADLLINVWGSLPIPYQYSFDTTVELGTNSSRYVLMFALR